MNVAAWIGSAAGLIVIGLAFIIMKFAPEVFGKFGQFLVPWITRLAIVLCFMGSATIAVTTAGGWISDRFGDVRDMFGAIGVALVVLAAVVLIFMVLIGVFPKPSKKAAYAALALPLVLALCAGGVLHKVDKQTGDSARQGTANVTAWLTGSSSGG